MYILPVFALLICSWVEQPIFHVGFHVIFEEVDDIVAYKWEQRLQFNHQRKQSCSSCKLFWSRINIGTSQKSIPVTLLSIQSWISIGLQCSHASFLPNLKCKWWFHAEVLLLNMSAASRFKSSGNIAMPLMSTSTNFKNVKHAFSEPCPTNQTPIHLVKLLI